MDYKEKVITLLKSQELSKEQKEKLEDIFPELAESEDERIRKAIINVFAAHKDYEIFFGVSVEDILAWLEKQGEHNKFRDSIQVGDKVTRNKYGVLVNLSQLKRVAKPADKQGEQKPYANETMNEKEDFDNGFTRMMENGQKPADKVEPKFKIGDWLVHKEMVGVTCCITQIHAPHYYLTNNNSFIKFGEEDNYRPWTIEDAKDGDVLSFDNEGSNYHSIGIFKRIASKNEPNGNTYRCYVRYGGFKEKLEIPKNGDELHHCGTSAHPAVKEQRDLLFQKMKESGYEWDAEKKELKKIESRQEELTEFEKAVKQVMEEAIECGDTHNLKADADMLLRLVQKPAWSEEDTKMVESIITDIEYCKKAYNNYSFHENEIGWLKSLKDRVQPKQEWNEEDKRKIDRIYSILRQAADTHAFSTTCRLIGDRECIELQDFLKSLRPQNHWKPSDEQINAVRLARAFVVDDFDDHTALSEILIELEKQLKKLREE